MILDLSNVINLTVVVVVAVFTYLEAYRLGMTASCFLHLCIAHLLLGFSTFKVYFI